MKPRPVSDSFELGDPYERYVGRWSRRVAPLFLAWLAAPAGLRWLDVGCGTGALCEAILEHCGPAAVTGVEPSDGFLATARRRLPAHVTLRSGSATALPLKDATVDAVVSGLVLNFVPEPREALEEFKRVTGSGGIVGAYVWDYAGRMDLIRVFWDAAVKLDVRAASLDEGVRFPLCHQGALAACFKGAGLDGVEVTALDVATPFASFEDYWEPFLGGQGPAPAYAMSLDEGVRAGLRERIRERLPIRPDGTIELVARAWGVRGVVHG